MIELPADDEVPAEASIYEVILDDICRGTLSAGQRLKVSDLTARFGVSASPVREVLRRMQGEGFVDIEPNRGASVRQINASAIQNTYEVLELLEPYFVAWFAEHVDSSAVDQLEAIQDKIEANGGGDQYRFRQLDVEFHGLICDAHYNSIGANTWRRLRTALVVHSSGLTLSKARIRAIMSEHRELIAAFRNNDAPRADQVIRKHLRGSFVQFSQQLRALGR